MKNIIFIAAPGAGKGTQSKLLEDKYHFSHISTGDLIRDEIKKNTPIGLEIKHGIEQGFLASDDIVFQLLDSKLKELSHEEGIVFDGFPRNLEQAKRYDERYDNTDMDIDYVIHIDIEEAEAMKRVLGRMTCTSCGAIYNEHYDTFTKEGHCNKCDGILNKRTDDNEETFDQRFKIYEEETKPLLEYYQNKKILYTVKTSLNKEDVFAEIESIIVG